MNLKIGTWNTMLQPWFTNETEVIKAVAETKFDVLALQSVWSEGAKDRILADPAVSRRYPYSHWTTAHQESAGADLDDPIMNYLVQNYVGCLIAYGVNTQQLYQPAGAPMPTDCQYLRIGIAIHNYNPANALAVACLENAMQELPPANAFDAVGICGASQGKKYAYNGSPGILILSRTPMTNIQEVPFEDFGVKRVNTHVTIQGLRLGIGSFQANWLLDIDPYLAPLQYGNSSVDQSNDMINAGVEVVVGTVNSGPDYQSEAHLNLLNHFAAQFALPTYCTPALSNLPQCVGKPQRSIDNIYIRNGIGSCKTDVFEQAPISDHIGIVASCLFTGR